MITLNARVASAAKVDRLPVGAGFKAYLKRQIPTLQAGEFIQLDRYRTDGWAVGLTGLMNSDAYIQKVWHKTASGWTSLPLAEIESPENDYFPFVSCASLHAAAVPASVWASDCARADGSLRPYRG